MKVKNKQSQNETVYLSINIFNGNNIDEVLAYEYDDNNLGEFDSEHYAFCYSRVIPYSLEFNKFGYVGVVNSCNNLENEYNTTTKKLFFVHTNNLGSTIALTDSSGSIVLSYDYDSYGNTYVMNSSGTYVDIDSYKGNLHGNTRLFTGREYDSETNLYFYRARYYSPELGRFISRDPIDTEDDVNLYSYVGDNPVNGVDPTGMYECDVKKIVNKVYDYGSNIKDVYDLIHNNINRLKFTAGTALALGGGTVAGVTGPACIATTTVSGGCAILATPTGPGMLVCTVPAIGMGVSCGTAAAGIAVAGLGSYMMSTSNGGVDNNKDVGSYTIDFKSGKQYHGKGPKTRATESAKRESKVNNDEVNNVDWTKAKDDKDAFIQEALRIKKSGGLGSNNYNRINSPGNKYLP